jgi:aminoglycoside phosphotransferase (APT) family kinase protein
LSPDEITARLAPFLERETGSPVALSELRPLAGGASRAAYALDIDVKEGAMAGRHACVLRLDLGGRIYETALGRAEELEVLRHVRRAGCLVPAALWAGDGSVLGRDFMILERIEGETIGRRIVEREELAAARWVLPQQAGVALGRIHAVDPAPLSFLPAPPPGQGPAQAVLERARRELDRIDEPHPALEIGWRWLREQAPASTGLVLVHGDFRLGNWVVGPEGLRAVLDWEFASLGDPHEDLAWPFVRDWRFGKDELRFAGLSDGSGFLAAYEEASGRTPDPRALHYWEVMGNFRWALGCLTQARRHLSGEEPSIELASLGRRAAEMELELMALLE